MDEPLDQLLTDTRPPRLLAIPGLRNARDLGGPGRLRSGLLYRSGWLAELTEEGTRELAKLGVRTVLDLRDPIELERFPDRTHDLSVTLAHFPLLPQDGVDRGDLPLTEIYPLIIDTAGPVLVAALRRLLEPAALPALVHCAVGRDRTGILSALLLALLGVSDEEITADYLLSNEGLGLLDGPVEYEDAHGVIRLSYPVRVELITDLLARVRSQHGNVQAYLGDHGLTDGEVSALRALLLE
ncbi:tyrosine-protein phosphatase [Kitasatospora sp. NPDC052896]|uniref:tyrosine-protein phosphatase n=1 Tax=Kitasatospora sp. NPDC052896 TaxID=3364061 RepID=UPI0037C723EF